MVSSFSYPADLDPVVIEAGKIAKREDKSLSEVIVSLLTDWVKAHGSGNPTFKLDQFQDPKMLALPTPWVDPDHDVLKGLSPQDAKFMLGQMAKWYPELMDVKKRAE